MEKSGRENRVRAQMVERLYTQAPEGIIATVVNAGLLALVLRGAVAASSVWAWLGAVVALSALRAAMVVGYRAKGPGEGEVSFWERIFLAGIFASGLLWGAAAVFLFPLDSPVHQAVLAIVICGLTAGAVGIFSSPLEAFAAFAVPAVSPLAVRFLLIPDGAHRALAAMAVLFLGLTFSAARRTSRIDRECLLLKEEFADRLDERTAELRGANERLRREVEERKRAQAALEESENKYRDIFDNVSDFLYLHDLDGNILETNRAWTAYGFDIQELRGLNIKDLLPERYLPEYDSYIHRLLEDGKAEGLMNFLGRDGREFVMEYRNHLVYDSDGRPAAVRGSGRDVTGRLRARKEKKELETQLMKAQRLEALGTLAGGIAHNFNNLLMGIRGNASLGIMELDESSPVSGRLEKIEGLVDRGAELTSQLLAYAREGKFQVKRLDPNVLVKAVAATLGETRKDIRVKAEIADGVPGVDADEGQIRQALMNLCVNAVEAMPSGGDLVIATAGPCGPPPGAEGGPYVMLSVRDTGVGMDQETIQRVFDPFFTTKGVGKGTGLGLASVYGIVESHGGLIRVDSEVGRGTSFDIYLPAAGSSGEDKERELMRDQDQAGCRGRTVLLVDDEDIIIEVGGQMLEKLGYEVLTAGTGQEAVGTYRTMGSRVDAVILDLIMPDMGGGETFDRLREIDPDVRVLLSSGYSIDGEASEILDRGCKGFIQKPFRLSELEDKLSRISRE